MTDCNDRATIRILLVEDNPGEARLLREELSDATSDHVEVVHADRLGAAIEQLGRSPFDVVLLDLSLPDARGLETLRRTREPAPTLPIVVLSGLDDDGVALQAVKSGAQDYLVKGQAAGPLLIRAVRYAIERKRAEETLRHAHDELETRVRERTAALEQANLALVSEVDERRRAEGQIRDLNDKLAQRLHRIAALRQIDTAISASLDLHLTFGIILNQVTVQLDVDAAAILLCNRFYQVLEYSAGTGFRTDGITRSRLRLGEGWAGRAALERRTISVPDLDERDEHDARAPLMVGERFVSYHAAPLIAKGQVQGILEIYHRTPLNPEPEWREFLETLAGQTAVAIENSTLFDELQRSHTELSVAYDATIEGWARALDLRDKETEGHSRRVTEMTLLLARVMGMSEAELVHVRRGALLHDIGKMGIPDGILLKPGPLTEEEWVVMRRHPGYAYEWLSPITSLGPTLDIPYCHHEKWDGSGYPRGIAGEQIPLAARIFAAVDIWDALRSDRPYRKAWPEEKVYNHIRSLAGSHLDPKVVGAFLPLIGVRASPEALSPFPGDRLALAAARAG